MKKKSTAADAAARKTITKINPTTTIGAATNVLPEEENGTDAPSPVSSMGETAVVSNFSF